MTSDERLFGEPRVATAKPLFPCPFCKGRAHQPYFGECVECVDCRATAPTPDHWNASVDTRLLDLLCVIHRDGGQYIDAQGVDKAFAAAMHLSSARIALIEDYRNGGK